jgi:hypothetical protein
MTSSRKRSAWKTRIEIRLNRHSGAAPTGHGPVGVEPGISCNNFWIPGSR